MKRPFVEDGAVCVASYSRDHRAVVNADGTIDIYRNATACTGDATATEKARAALEAMNRANEKFWRERNGIPG